MKWRSQELAVLFWLFFGLGLIVVLRVPDSDMKGYFQIFEDLRARKSISGFFEEVFFGHVKPKRYEFLFYYISRFLSFVLSNKFIVIAWNFVFLYFLLRVEFDFFRSKDNHKLSPILIFSAFLLSINILGPQHLIRQYAAAGIMTFWLVSFLTGRKNLLSHYLIIALSIHISSIIFVFIGVLVKFLYRYDFALRLSKISRITSFLILLLSSSLVARKIIDHYWVYTDSFSVELNSPMLLLDSILLLYSMWQRKFVVQVFGIVMVILFSLYYASYQMPLLAVRLYVFIEPIRFLILLDLFKTNIFRKTAELGVIGILLISLSFAFLRMLNTPFIFSFGTKLLLN